MAKCCKSVAKFIPAVTAWTILISATAVFFIYICPDLVKKYHYSMILVQAVITIFVVTNFFLATFMDPGVIPKAGPDEDNDDDFRAPLYKSVEINGTVVRMKWCVTCQFYRPPRCSHCSNCNTCIETFDHHCPWVNNCIGRRNYRHFFFFLIFLTIHMFSVFVWSILFVLDHRDSLHETSSIIAVVLICMIGLLFIPIFGLTVFHIYLVARGRTTNEQVTGKFSGLYNPFSGGCAHNFCLVLCGPRYPKRKQIKHHSSSRVGRGGVYYKAEDVKIFTDKDPQTKSINTLLKSPKSSYPREQAREPFPIANQKLQHTSKPPSTAGSKQVINPSSPPPGNVGPSGGVVIYYSPATSSVSANPTAVVSSPMDAHLQLKSSTEVEIPEAQSKSFNSSFDDSESRDTVKREFALQSTPLGSYKIVSTSSPTSTNSPSISSSSSASTVIHQPIVTNQDQVQPTTTIIKSTTAASANNGQGSDTVSVTSSTRISGFKKYEISV